MKLIRGRLSTADFSPTNTRYDATCNCIQYTADDGATWTDAPGLDPRHSPAFLKPPVAGSSKQCDSAANMVKWLKDFIDYETGLLTAGATIVTIANAIFSPLDFLFPAGDFVALIFGLAETIFDIGATALTAAFTSDQYDLLLCIFYCACDSDGRVSAEKFAIVQSQITDQLNTTAGIVVNAILFVQGEVGLSNAGAIGSQTGDCSACDCGWCYEWDFLTSDGGYAPFYYASTWTSGTGWQAGNDPTPATKGTGISKTFTATGLTSVSFKFDGITGSTPGNMTIFLFLAGTQVARVDSSWSTNPDAEWSWSDPSGVTADEIVLAVQTSGAGVLNGQANIFEAKAKGEGTNPFGSDNC